MKMKKVMSLLALFCVLALVVTGCAQTPSTTAAPTTTGTGTTASTTVEESNVNAKGVFPIVKEKVVVKLATPQSPLIENYDTNYFTLWLEEKTNIDIQFDLLPADGTVQKAQLIMASMTDMPDAFIGLPRTAGGAAAFSTTNIMKYGVDGQIIGLNDLVAQYGDELIKLWDKYKADGLQQMMTSADGNIYYMPGYGPSLINRYYSKFFINQGWLDKLKLQTPTTTEEFYNVLKAFKTQDPNGNNKADEIPVTGSEKGTGTMVYEYLMGAFVNNPGRNQRFYSEGGKLVYAPATDGWREGLKYLNRLTSEGLLDSLSFTQDDTQLKQIVNDPNNILGGFTGLGIGMAAQPNDKDVMARYIGIAPLKGPAGVQLAMTNAAAPMANGFITTSCENPDVVFRLFDFMLSEEASTIARYGEKGVNWDAPEAGKLSNYGTPATLKLVKDIWNTFQNTHWTNYNPFVNDIHNDGAAWNGDVLNAQYINAQTALKMQPYEPDPASMVAPLIYLVEDVADARELQTIIDGYIIQALAMFATGQMDPNSDADWNQYLSELENQGLAKYVEMSQAAYDNMK